MRDRHDTKTANMDMSTLIDYARVPTAKQSLEIQIDALKKTGRYQISTNVASGAEADRPDLDKVPEYLCNGDTLVVWKIDRLGCSPVHLVQTTNVLRERGVGFRSFIDTGIGATTCSDKLLLDLFATLTEFERDLVNEWTKASLAVAKARGRSGGRRATVTPEKLAKACRLMDKKGLTIKKATVALDADRSMLYRALNAECDTPAESDE